MVVLHSMKAIIITEPGGPEVLEIGEYETPNPQVDEVRIRVKATALNRADTLQRRGLYPPPPGASPILGLEVAGVVESFGASVTNVKVGDKVCALLAGGGYAEYACVHKDLLLPVPVGMTCANAAGIPEVFMTAYQALVYLAELKEGETILIHAGASGVGTAAIQIARSLGARVIVTASAGKHQLCKDLGASHCIDYRSQNFETEVANITDGKGVNVILDFLAASYFQQNINSMAVDARMVMLAAMGGVKVSDLDMGKIVWKRLKIMGSTLRARSIEYKIKLTQDLRGQFWSKFEDATFKPIIDSQFDWTEVVIAHKRMDANLNAGKIILEIN